MKSKSLPTENSTNETYNYDVEIVGEMIGKCFRQNLVLGQTTKPITFLSYATNVC